MLSSLLDHTAAAALLRQGCVKLHLPDAAAVELLRFLMCKRMHDQDAGPRPREMTPGVQLEQLWTWMLLRTKVWGYMALAAAELPAHHTQQPSRMKAQRCYKPRRGLTGLDRQRYSNATRKQVADACVLT